MEGGAPFGEHLLPGLKSESVYTKILKFSALLLLDLHTSPVLEDIGTHTFWNIGPGTLR